MFRRCFWRKNPTLAPDLGVRKFTTSRTLLVKQTYIMAPGDKRPRAFYWAGATAGDAGASASQSHKFTVD